VEKAVEDTGKNPEATNTVQGTVIMTEYQGSWVKVAVKREGAENFIAHIPDDRFFANPVTEGDRIIARWTTEAVHSLVHEGAEDMNRLYGEDFNSPRV
ncbi:MAG: TOBE domain-containing protein, partial [Desulfobacterales bacterium]